MRKLLSALILTTMSTALCLPAQADTKDFGSSSIHVVGVVRDKATGSLQTHRELSFKDATGAVIGRVTTDSKGNYDGYIVTPANIEMPVSIDGAVSDIMPFSCKQIDKQVKCLSHNIVYLK